MWFETLARFNVRIRGVANYELIKQKKYYSCIAEFLAEKPLECPFVTTTEAPGGRPIVDGWNIPADTFIIFDEAHKGKNRITANSKFLLSSREIIALTGPRLFVLSATIVDTIESFWVLARLMQLVPLGGHAYKAWLRGLAVQYPTKSQLEALHAVIYPAYGSRMQISVINAQHAGTFQPNLVRAECFPISPAAELDVVNAYQEINTAIQRLKNKQQNETCILTIILRARQRIELIKVPTIAQQAIHYLSTGHAVVIFVNFNETTAELFKPLDAFVQSEYKSFITFVVGGQSPSDRDYNTTAFRDGRSLLMIANIQSGGTGISFHHTDERARPRASIISPPWSGIALKQALGRIHRAGALSAATQIIVYCRGCVSPAGDKNTNNTSFGGVGVEEMIAKKVNEKLNTIGWINDGTNDDVVII
jgi:hypothetical protein